MKAIYSLIVLWTLVWHIQFSNAVREGTANAKVMIQRYERAGDFAKAALWHQAAADCLKIISIPMTEIQIRYHRHQGKNALAERRREELADVKERREYHLKTAKTYWEKSDMERISPELEPEREKITQFISTWAQIYPNRFYYYGIYPSFFKAEQEIFKRKGDYAAVLNLEADAAEMCADQYNEITVAYLQGIALDSNPPPCKGEHDNPDLCRFIGSLDKSGSGLVREVGAAPNHNTKGIAAALRGEAISHRGKNCPSAAAESCVAQYEKVRDAHRRRAVLLREIAKGKPKTPLIEADLVLKDLSHQAINPAPKLTSTQALSIASRDTHLQTHLKTHTGVHAYASFQGFAWFVSYYNHGWGNLGIVLVDDKTGTVLDILNWLMPKESAKR